MDSRGLFGFVLCAAGLAVPARAQDFVPVPMDARELEGVALAIIDADSPVPSNGSFLFWLNEYELMFSDTPIVQVARTTGPSTEIFGGSMRQVIGPYWAWTAAEPLEPGEYFVALSDPSLGTDRRTIEVVAEAVIEPPTFTAALLAIRYDTRIGEATCGNQAFVTRVFGEPYVQAGFDFSSPPEVNHQFLYRVVTGDLSLEPFRSWDEVPPVGPFPVDAESYCVRIEVMDLATSTVHAYPDEVCTSPGDIGVLGERSLEIPDYVLHYDQCAIPPAGFEERWCTVNEECLVIWRNEALARASGCFNYFNVCPDAMRPDAGQPDVPDLPPADGGSQPAVDAAAESDGGHDAPLHGSGCGCRTVRAMERSEPWLLAFAAIMAAAWRAPRLRARRSRDLGG